MGLGTETFTDKQRLILAELNGRRATMSSKQTAILDELIKRSAAPRAQERTTAGPILDTPPSAMPSLQTPGDTSPGLLFPLGSFTTAPAVSTGVQPRLTEESFKFSKLPQKGISAREKPLRKRTTEEKKEFFVQRAADIVGGDINKLILAQVPDPETTSQVETAAIALTHGLFPLIAAKSPIAQAERANLEERFPITFMASELAGAALPITGAFKGTRFAIQPLAKAITKAVAKSSESKQVLTRFGLKATEGAVAGAVFDVLRGETPSPESAAMFAAFEVAIPGMQGLFRELKITLANPQTAEPAKKAALASALELFAQTKGRQELTKAAKTAEQVQAGSLVAKENQLIGDILTDRFRDPSLAPKQLERGPILQPGKVPKPKPTAKQKKITERAQEIRKEIEAELAKKKAARTLPKPSFIPAKPAKSSGQELVTKRNPERIWFHGESVDKPVSAIKTGEITGGVSPRIETARQFGKPGGRIFSIKEKDLPVGALAELDEQIARGGAFQISSMGTIPAKKFKLVEPTIPPKTPKTPKVPPKPVKAKTPTPTVARLRSLGELPEQKIGKLEPIERQRGALLELPERVSIHIAPGNRRQIVVMSDQGVQIPLSSVGESDPKGTDKLIKIVGDFLNSPESQARAKKVFGSAPTFKKAVAEKREIGGKQFLNLFFPKKPPTEIPVISKKVKGLKPKQPKPTLVKGGKPQENLALGVQATVPPGKIKTVQGPKEGFFAPKAEGKQAKLGFEAGAVPRKQKPPVVDFDPIDEVVSAGIKLRKGDFFRGKLREEIVDLKRTLAKKFPGRKIFDKGGQTLDEHASNLGITEEQLRQQLMGHVPPSVRAKNFAEAERFFQENAVRSAIGGIAGLGVDDEGNPTFNATASLIGIAATVAGSKVLTSARLKRIGLQAIETFQNSQIRVRKLQELKGVKLRGKALDLYETEIRYHGKIGGKLRNVKEVAEKIDKGMAHGEKKISNTFSKDINDYVVALHAPDVNKVLNKPKAAGITTAEAIKRVNEINSLPHAKQIKDVAKQIKNLSNQTLDILVDGQIIDNATRIFFRKRYPNYVSLNRVLDNLQDSEIAKALISGPGRNISVIGTGLKRIKGSELEISNVLTNTVANVEQAFARAEKNTVGLSVLTFARNNKHLGLFKELKFGKDIPVIGTGPKGRPIFDTGKLFRDESILGVRENGKQIFLKISDPSLATAIRMDPQSLDPITRAVGVFTRYITQTATRFNPAFPPLNIFKDTPEMVVFLMAQKEFGIRGAVGATSRIPKSMKDITDAVFRGLDTPGTKLYRQLIADGGTTGGFASSTRKAIEINMEKIRKTNRSRPRKVIKSLVDFMDKYNSIFEDATRLSVYKTALARGLTRKEAAVFAKEATINFNRKGTLGAQINSWWGFANVSAQGSAKMFRAMTNPKVAATVTATVATAVWGQNQWNDAIYPGWRDEVPPWERNNNLVIITSPRKKGEKLNRLLWPVSWGIKPIKTFMDYAIDLMQGHDRGSKGDIVAGIAGSALDAYNPIGGSNLGQAIMPTIADVPFDVWTNTKWFGSPISNEDPFLPDLSDHMKYFRSTRKTQFGRYTIAAAKYLDEKAGISISPEVLKYNIEQYGGGTGRFLTRSFNTITQIGTGNLQDINDAPVIRRFFKSTPADVVERYKQTKKLNDPSLKTLQQASDDQEKERKISVRDAFDQFKKATEPSEKKQIFKDLLNKDPKAFKSLTRRIKDDLKGIDYYDSVLKDLEPNFRAERVMIELKRAQNKKARFVELVKAKVVDAETVIELKKLGFTKESLLFTSIVILGN